MRHREETGATTSKLDVLTTMATMATMATVALVELGIRLTSANHQTDRQRTGLSKGVSKDRVRVRTIHDLPRIDCASRRVNAMWVELARVVLRAGRRVNGG